MLSEFDLQSAQRRDFRNSKSDPEIPRHRRRGNRKKVCKKSPDKEHTYILEDRFPTAMFSFKELKCVYCGRIEFGSTTNLRMADKNDG